MIKIRIVLVPSYCDTHSPAIYTFAQAPLSEAMQTQDNINFLIGTTMKVTHSYMYHSIISNKKKSHIIIVKYFIYFFHLSVIFIN